MVTDADIRLQNVRVGRVHADSTRIRGEGGPHDPRLVLPVDVELYSRPKAQQLALVGLTGSLHTSSPPFPGNQIGPTCHLDLLKRMSLRTIPGSPISSPIELRFSLTQPLIKYLEDMRHSDRQGAFTLFLRLEGILVWLRCTYNADEVQDAGWSRHVGLVSEALPFWETQIGELRLEVEQSSWVQNVLPGLGHNRVRLIEINLAQMPEQGVTVERFDEALREFDEGRYADCVATCRDIRHAWEQALGATKQRPIARVIAEQLDWPDTDWHYHLLDKLWAAFADISNVPQHTVQTPQPLPVAAADAKLCLQMTLALSEYVDRARRDAVSGS